MLNKITENLKNVAIKWLAHNDSIRIKSNRPQGRNTKHESSIAFISKLITSVDESTGVIDFPSAVFVFEEPLKSSPPFKFGNVATLSFDSLSNMQMLDFSALNCDEELSIQLKDSRFNMDLLPKLLEPTKSINKLRIVNDIKDITKTPKNLVSSIQSFLNLKTCSKIEVYFSNASYVIIIITPVNSIIRLISPNNNGLVHGGPFNNVMDVQEWLFDNGFDYLL